MPMTIKAGERVEVRLKVIVPEDCTDEQLQEWLEFHLGATGSIKAKNPLHRFDLEGYAVEVQP